MVKQACFFLRLLTAVVNTAKSSGMDVALALRVPWHIEWITPPHFVSSFDALSEPRLWHEWLRGTAVGQLPVDEGRDVDILGSVPEMLNELLRRLRPCAFSCLAESIPVRDAQQTSLGSSPVARRHRDN
ncbi:hypothetical protein V8D89_001358 [Ganoderma adspersum]